MIETHPSDNELHDLIQTSCEEYYSEEDSSVMNTVTIYRSSIWTTPFDRREDWFRNRVEGLSFMSEKEGEEAAEEAFVLTNAPDEILTEDQKHILKKEQFKGPSLSVGDIVKVESVVNKKLPDYYLCKIQGWEMFKGNRIELLKHIS